MKLADYWYCFAAVSRWALDVADIGIYAGCVTQGVGV